MAVIVERTAGDGFGEAVAADWVTAGEGVLADEAGLVAGAETVGDPQALMRRPMTMVVATRRADARIGSPPDDE
jgi:hypothetical protein